jgi:hypothetical protein
MGRALFGIGSKLSVDLSASFVEDYADYTDYKNKLRKISHRFLFALASYAGTGTHGSVFAKATPRQAHTNKLKTV